jgi:hypothetical protein
MLVVMDDVRAVIEIVAGAQPVLAFSGPAGLKQKR